VNQVLSTKISISGKGFFTITKSSIFKVSNKVTSYILLLIYLFQIAGVVMTYELVLLQLKAQLIPNDGNEEFENKTIIASNSRNT
jgi:hypothetical protein